VRQQELSQRDLLDLETFLRTRMGTGIPETWPRIGQHLGPRVAWMEFRIVSRADRPGRRGYCKITVERRKFDEWRAQGEET